MRRLKAGAAKGKIPFAAPAFPPPPPPPAPGASRLYPKELMNVPGKGLRNADGLLILAMTDRIVF